MMNDALQQAKAGNADAAAEALAERMRLYGLAMDRVLKLPDGTIEVAEKGFAYALISEQ